MRQLIALFLLGMVNAVPFFSKYMPNSAFGKGYVEQKSDIPVGWRTPNGQKDFGIFSIFNRNQQEKPVGGHPTGIPWIRKRRPYQNKKWPKKPTASPSTQ